MDGQAVVQCPSMGIGASGARFYQKPFLRQPSMEETLEASSVVVEFPPGAVIHSILYIFGL